VASDLPYVMARLPADFIARWKLHCTSLGMTCNNALELAMSRFMGEKVNPISLRFVAIPESSDATRLRQEVRLTGSEVEAMDKRARACGTSRRKYITNLVRAHLLQEPQLGMTELAVIGESNKQLAAYGRHFNQIAKKLNSGESIESRSIAHSLNRVKEEIDEHLAYVHRVMRSNLDRWPIVEASNDEDR